jgi:hypothetical protein
MPFEVKVEADALLKQFDDVQTRINEMYTGLPQVFLDWQREDMNRKYPTIDAQTGRQMSSEWSVTTLIYPRSRRARTSGPNNKGKATNRKPQRRVVGTKRPILRPVLVDQLFDRMKRLCREAIEWR